MGTVTPLMVRAEPPELVTVTVWTSADCREIGAAVKATVEVLSVMACDAAPVPDSVTVLDVPFDASDVIVNVPGLVAARAVKFTVTVQV